MSKIIFDDDAIRTTCYLHNKTTKFIVAMEEMGECIKEISKSFRGHRNNDRLAEEIADVYFSLAQIAHIIGIPMVNIQQQIEEKMERQRIRDIEGRDIR